jgi:hypothetical protein
MRTDTAFPPVETRTEAPAETSAEVTGEVAPGDGSAEAVSASAGPSADRIRRREAVALGVLAVLGWSGALWVSSHLHVDPTLSRVALFAHMASLVAGLGAALTIDYLALLWVLGRRTLREVLTLSRGTSVLVWVGLVGLMASGALLSPDLSSGLTQVKLGLVLVVALNGAFSGVVQHHLEGAWPHPSRALMAVGIGTALVSQAGWWGAAVVGFLNSQC